MGRRAGHRVGVVFDAGKKGLRGTCCVCSGSQKGRDGVADGVRCRMKWRRSEVLLKINNTATGFFQRYTR